MNLKEKALIWLAKMIKIC